MVDVKIESAGLTVRGLIWRRRGRCKGPCHPSCIMTTAERPAAANEAREDLMDKKAQPRSLWYALAAVLGICAAGCGSVQQVEPIPYSQFQTYPEGWQASTTSSSLTSTSRARSRTRSRASRRSSSPRARSEHRERSREIRRQVSAAPLGGSLGAFLRDLLSRSAGR